jgi:hypothetical protein
MKSFHQFLSEAEDYKPLNLVEAVECFCIFDEELNETEKLQVLEELTEEDLINLAWLKEYLIEAELVPGAANKAVPFKRVHTDLDNLLKQIRSEGGPKKSTSSSKTSKTSKIPKVTPNSQQYSQPTGPQRPVSDFKVSKSGLQAAKDVAASRKPSAPTIAPSSSGGMKQSLRNLKTKISNVKMPKVSVPSGVKNVAGTAGRLAGPALTVVDAGLRYKERKDAGESRRRSAAGSATEVGGGLAAAAGGARAGAALGSVLGPKGAAVGGVVGGIGGYAAGSEVGKKVFNVAAGASPQQKKAMATSNRQKQAGTGIVGTGGPTKVDTKKNTITTGGKTVALPKMQVNPQTGKAGYLAYKGGQATYKTAADPSTLAKTSTVPLERIGRTFFPGAYAKQDAAAKAAQLKQAQAGTASYKKSLGVK